MFELCTQFGYYKESRYEHLHAAFCVNLFWDVHHGIAGSSCNSVFSMFMYSQGDSETTFTISHSANSKDGGFTGPHPRPHLLLSILLVTGFLEAVRLWDPMVLPLMTNDNKHAFMHLLAISIRYV